METSVGTSVIILIEKANLNLRTQLSTFTSVCEKSGSDFEIMIFSREANEELEAISQAFKNTNFIKHEAINFCPSALRSGLKMAKYEKVLISFSDDIVTESGIEQMLIGLEHYHFVCGARAIVKEGFRTSIYRWVWHKLVRLLFNISLKDINCPYKAVLCSKAKEIGFLESDGTLAHTELAARMKARKMKIAEFPLETFHPESQDVESYSLLVLIETLFKLVKLKRKISSTKKRLSNESDFHNAWASTINIDDLLIHENFEAVTAVENKYAYEAMGDIKGKRILDLGCGAGETSVYFALKGAKVTAVDISEEMIEVVNRLADKWGAEVETKIVIGEDMDIESGSYDFVFGNGVLHHLDRKKGYDEILRVLKPGGKAIFIEPLCYNPIISIYRMLARTVRTKNERPFNFSDFQYLERLFAEVKHTEFWLATQLVFVYFFLVKRVNPQKERYWKKVIKEADSISGMYSKLLKVDNWLLERMPFLRRLCWNTVIVLEKEAKKGFVE